MVQVSTLTSSAWVLLTMRTPHSLVFSTQWRVRSFHAIVSTGVTVPVLALVKLTQIFGISASKLASTKLKALIWLCLFLPLQLRLPSQLDHQDADFLWPAWTRPFRVTTKRSSAVSSSLNISESLWTTTTPIQLAKLFNFSLRKTQ